MANWLQNTSKTAIARLRTVNLPALRPPQLPGSPPNYRKQSQAQLPPASIIYGVAASALIVMSIYFLFSMHWITGLLILLPAAALLGFALHFLKR